MWSRFSTWAIWLTLLPMWFSSRVHCFRRTPISFIDLNLLGFAGSMLTTASLTSLLTLGRGRALAFSLTILYSVGVSRINKHFVLLSIFSSCEKKTLQIFPKFGKFTFCICIYKSTTCYPFPAQI